MSDAIRIRREGPILKLTFDRPERRNAINEGMMTELTAVFADAADDAALRVILISGAGRDFSAGGDIKDIASVLGQSPAERSAHFRKIVRRGSMPLFLAMHRLPQPIVLAARGHVIGAAMQMACVADLVVASETARFSIPQVDLAHTVDHGESWYLPRKIGLARAMQMCLLAERIDAATAERFGLANWVVPDSELEGRAEAIAVRIAGSPPIAARGMKALLRNSWALGFEDQFERENATIGEAVATDDFIEAINSFVEKRKPVFTGR